MGRLLLVDDDADMLRVSSEIFRADGYEVEEASTGAEALARTAGFHPDVVLLDVGLPDMSGKEVCRRIKKDPACVDVLVAMISGQARTGQDQLLGADAGADDYILKPVGPEELLARVKMLVRLRHTTTALRASEQHYRGLIEILPDAVCVLDLEGRIVTCNAQAAELLGLGAPSELVQKVIFDFTVPEDRERLRGNILRAAAADESGVHSAECGVQDSLSAGAGAKRGREGDIADREPATKQIPLTPAPLPSGEGNRVPAEAVQWPNAPSWSGKSQLYAAVRRDGTRLAVEVSAAAFRDEAGQTSRVVLVARDVTQRQASEERLRGSEQRFRLLAEHIREAFWITDPGNTRVVYISPGYEAIWGRSRESLYESPLSWLEALHPADRDRVRAAAFAPQGLEQFDEVYRVLRPDGSLRWIHDRAFPVRDAAGQVYRVVGIAEDITTRKQMEETLRRSEARKTALMESALDGIITIDPEGRILEFNSAAEKKFGYGRASAVGKRLPGVILPTRLWPWFEEGLRQIFAGPTGLVLDRPFETFGRHSAGHEFPIEVSLSRTLLEGQPIYTAFVRDISARKQAEQQVRLLADAVQSTQELISITDQANRFTFVNQAFLKAYGYAEAEVLGRTPEFLYSDRNPAGLCAQVHSQTLAGTWHGEILNRRKDGREFPLLLSTASILDRDGKIIGLMGVGRDISEAKRAEKATAAFAQLGRRLSAATDAQQAATIILDIASELFGWDAGFVDLYSAEQDKVNPVVTMDTIDGVRQLAASSSLPEVPTPMMRLVMLEGPKLVRQEEGPPPASLLPFGDTRRRSASRMYVPIHSGSSVVGMLSVQSYRAGAYGPADLRLLETLADHCGDALHRVNVAAALRAAEANYLSIFENATEGIFRSTPEGRLLVVNPALARMFKYGSAEDMLARIRNLGQQVYVAAGRRQELLRQLAAEGSTQGFQAECYRKDGSRIWISVNAHTVRDAAGKVQYLEGTVGDITERQRVEAQLRELPRRIIEAQEAERLRVARELHDSVNQMLASVQMRLRLVQESAADLRPSAREILSRCRDLLVEALEENRRIAHDLRPSDLDELGLVAACRNFCRQFGARIGVSVRCRIERIGPRLSPALELNLFRIVQEAFNNIEKHAHAKRANLRLWREADSLLLKITDDGCGIEPERQSRKHRKHAKGIGLTNMTERAAALGGNASIISQPGQGTTILVRVPYAAR